HRGLRGRQRERALALFGGRWPHVASHTDAARTRFGDARLLGRCRVTDGVLRVRGRRRALQRCERGLHAGARMNEIVEMVFPVLTAVAGGAAAWATLGSRVSQL